MDEFRYFIESLYEEKKSWSLYINIYDKNLCKGIDDIETWYNVHKRYKFGIGSTKNIETKITGVIQPVIFAKYSKNLIGFISGKTTIENEDIIEEFGTYNFLEISFVLKKEYQNFGIGTNLLKEIIKLVIKFNQSWEMAISHDIIHARYKSGNISSKKVFEKNNFIEHKYDGKNKSVIRTWKLLNESDHSLFEEYVNNINSRKKFIENTKKELFNNILKLGDKNE